MSTPLDFHYCQNWEINRNIRTLRYSLIRSNIFQVQVIATGDVFDCVVSKTRADRPFDYMVLARVPGTSIGSPLDRAANIMPGGTWYGWGNGHSLRSLCEIEHPASVWYSPSNRNRCWGMDTGRSWWHVRTALMMGLRLNGFEAISDVRLIPGGGLIPGQRDDEPIPKNWFPIRVLMGNMRATNSTINPARFP